MHSKTVSDDGHLLITRILQTERVVLDRVAFDLMASVLVAHGRDSLFSFESCRGEELDGHSVTFILFSALSLSSLELLSSICTSCKIKSASIFTSIPASANAGSLNITANGVNYPETPVVLESQHFGSIRFGIEYISPITFSKFSNIYILSRFHPLIQEDTGFTGAFHELDSFLWDLNAVEHVYSFGRLASRIASTFTSEFQPALERRKHLLSNSGARSATVIIIDDLAMCDPIGCIMPYIKPNHLLDSVFAELSPDGHRLTVSWDSLSHLSSLENVNGSSASSMEPFYTDLLQSSNLGELSWLSSQLMLKPQEALIALQNELLKVSNAVSHPLPELPKVPQNGSQWASLFLQQVKILFGPVCNSGKLELLDTIHLIVACSCALSASDRRLRGESAALNPDATYKSGLNVEKFLMRFERSLLMASQLDSRSLSQLEEPTKCEPILFHALSEIKQLTYLDERFLVVVYLLSLLPVNLPISSDVWETVEELLASGQRSRDFSGLQGGRLIPTCMTPARLVKNLQSLREKRRVLPSYNNLWSAKPRYRSPLVQMTKDLFAARANPKESSPSLKGLTYHAPSSGSGTWFTGWSRYLRMPISESQHPEPYHSDYLVLVLCGGVTFALARELMEAAVSSNCSNSDPLKLKIVSDRFIGGPSGLSGFFSLNE